MTPSTLTLLVTLLVLGDAARLTVVGDVPCAQVGHGALVCSKQGDLTRQPGAAIVNAANGHLAHGGGIAGALVSIGGQAIQAESDKHIETFGSLPVGHTAVTGAGSLPARRIIHVVGPVFNGSPERDNELRIATLNVLRTARRLCLNEVAIPLLSSGIFGYPKALAAKIIVNSVFEFFKGDTKQPDESVPGRLPPIETCDLTRSVPSRVTLMDLDIDSAYAFMEALEAIAARSEL
jgi:O-acetyl-ADP-ribose deacetylase (regulator of RNase III)